MDIMLWMKILTVLGTAYCGLYQLSHLRAKKILSYFPKVNSKLGKEFKLNQIDKNGNVIRDSSGKPKVSNKLIMTIRRVNTKQRHWIEHNSTKIKDDNKIN